MFSLPLHLVNLLIHEDVGRSLPCGRVNGGMPSATYIIPVMYLAEHSPTAEERDLSAADVGDLCS
jgi:hypothetical protein